MASRTLDGFLGVAIISLQGEGAGHDPDPEGTFLLGAKGDILIGLQHFNLGSRTGEGFHRVNVTTPGSLTFAEFCATAEPAAPKTISVAAQAPVRGVVGQPLSNPLSVIVADEGGNPDPGVPVTLFGGIGRR